jgi:hypothetical protein
MTFPKPRGKHARPKSHTVGRTTYALAGSAAIAATPLVASSAARAADTPALDGTGVVTMIHAVPGLVADVSVDGKQVLTNFTASRVTDPITLSAGKHTVKLTAENGAKAGDTVLTTNLDITAGTTSTAVVGLSASGAPKAFVFPEMPVSIPSGKATAIFRAVAATGPVTMVIDGAALPGAPLGNGASAQAVVAAGSHQVVVKNASGATVLGAQSAPLQADRVTTLYLTGSAQAKTLSWVATTRLASSLIPLNAVPTGDGSTVRAAMTTREDIPTGTAGLVAGAAGLATFALIRRRSRPRAAA